MPLIDVDPAVDATALPGVGLSGLWDGVGFVIEGVFLAAVEEEKPFGNVDHGVQIGTAGF